MRGNKVRRNHVKRMEKGDRNSFLVIRILILKERSLKGL
jgi:hypothetical protein